MIHEVESVKCFRPAIDTTKEKALSLLSSFSDIAVGVGSLRTQFKTSSDRLDGKLTTFGDTLSQMQSKLSANTALITVLTKKLEVCIFFFLLNKLLYEKVRLRFG